MRTTNETAWSVVTMACYADLIVPAKSWDVRLDVWRRVLGRRTVLRIAHCGCSTVVLICFTYPAITVGTVAYCVLKISSFVGAVYRTCRIEEIMKRSKVLQEFCTQ